MREKREKRLTRRREEEATENGLSSPSTDGLKSPSLVWSNVLIPDVLEKVRIGKNNQIQSSEMLPQGRLPVIDQGQDYIAGYCNDESRVIRDELPLVIFGDHTRCVKYVDFTVLKEKFIPAPPLTTQCEIAAVLGQVQKAIEEQERLLALTEELKRTLLYRLFAQGLRSELQKQTEIGPVPESWDVVPLGSIAKVGNGSTPKRDNQAYWQDGHIPWLNSARIHDRFIRESDQFVTDLAVKECHLPRVKANSLLIAITGQGKTLGNSALVEFETCINQHLAYAQFTSPKVLPAFVLWYMQTRYEHLRSISRAGGSTKGALTCGYLKTYPIPVPSLNEQKDIVAVFSALEAREKYRLSGSTMADIL